MRDIQRRSDVAAAARFSGRFFFIILRLSRLYCEKLFLIMFPSRVSLSDVLSSGFLAGLAFQSFPWQLSHKKTSRIYLFYL